MDLVTLLSAITFSVKTVGAMVRCLGLPCSAGAKNVREANESANETWIKSLTASRACSLLVSEECEEPISVSQPGTGQYAVVFDPLTGLAEPPTQDMGAIFGIFRQLSAAGEEPSLRDVLQPARQLVAAGYAVYGSSTMLVLTTGHGVDGFTLDPSLQEFVLTHPRLQVPFAGDTYSINEGYASSFDDRTKLMLETLKEEPTLDGAPRTCRYVGSMVPDVHRTLLYGGVFIYPAHAGRPMGRLKLLYEAGPLAFVAEQRGGRQARAASPFWTSNPRVCTTGCRSSWALKTTCPCAHRTFGRRRGAADPSRTRWPPFAARTALTRAFAARRAERAPWGALAAGPRRGG
eukprot:TRINITY_DN206_c0_g1_i10.p1 TRINITY_DN206_c0_g1~~TRINITY_DN206_c0_g1_i10.p1  ORF type:complete len:347 (+),score=74.29 TRINITY_DN206_c0_g1_i10:620-1660(+)